MNEPVYKILELTGSSKKSMEDAIQGAIARAAKTMRNLLWFEMVETRGRIKGAKVEEWQVTLKIGFSLED